MLLLQGATESVRQVWLKQETSTSTLKLGLKAVKDAEVKKKVEKLWADEALKAWRRTIEAIKSWHNIYLFLMFKRQKCTGVEIGSGTSGGCRMTRIKLS